MRFSVCLGLLLLPLLLFGQQKGINGKIQTNTRWSGYVLVNGDITVEKGVTLSIEPGTRIVIRANKDRLQTGNDRERVELVVHGTLIANGESGEGRIRFTSSRANPQMGDWYGLILKSLSDKSVLKHVTVEYGYKGVTCYGSSPDILESEFRFNHYAGISCEVRATPFIKDCVLIGNDFAGLACELASFPVVEGTIITQNTNGVLIFDRSQPNLGRIRGEGGSRGLNEISNNFDFDVYNKSSKQIYAQNNSWSASRLSEIGKLILDNEDDKASGRVLVEPVFRSTQRPSYRSLAVLRDSDSRPILPTGRPAGAATTPLVRNVNESPQTEASDTPVDVPEEDVLLTQQQTAEPDSSVEARFSGEPYQITSVETAGQQKLQEQEKLTEAPAIIPTKPQSPPQEDKTADDTEALLSLVEPINEGLLDAGRREYVRRVKPKYPEIYRRTQHEGKVFMEVIVDRDGSILSSRLLRSDGDYFTSASEYALQQTRYKPGTFRGKPVQFRIIEPFVFKLNASSN